MAEDERLSPQIPISPPVRGNEVVGPNAQNRHERNTERQTDHPLEAPILTADQLEMIRADIPRARHALSQILHWYDILRTQNPAILGNLLIRHPQIMTHLEGVRVASEHLDENNAHLTNEAIMQAVDDYNIRARELNDVLDRIRNESRDAERQFLDQATHGQLHFDETEFTQAEKAEMRRFVRDAWNELFPTSHTERFIRWVTETKGHVAWQGWQRVAVAPAVGIENVAMGFIDMFQLKSWNELIHTAGNLYEGGWEGLTNMWRVMKYAVDELPASDTVSPAISLLVAMCTLWGGVTKLGQLSRTLNYSPRVMRTIRSIAGTRTVTHIAHAGHNVIPVAMITEAMLPYLEY